MLKLVLVVAFIGGCTASVATLRSPVGEPVLLDLGTHVRNWGRMVDGKKQYLAACPENDNSEKCKYWSNEEKKVDTTTSESRVFMNGTLVIYHFTESDAGAYFSPDERERVVEAGDGSFGALPRTLINVLHLVVA
ncbi:unnamed protein product, partial [Mesorhabditis spiculigera]